MKLIGIERTLKIMQLGISSSKLEQIALKAGYLIEREAVKLITEKGHVDTGRLRSSIRTISRKQGLYEVIVRVGTDVFYSVFVEALPDGGFLFPAYRNKKGEVTELLKRDIQSALKKRGYL